jgi:cytochrome o ubiquinol oxidase subunit 3
MTTLTQHVKVETYSKTIFGFWIYIMTDCVLFGTLFATYAVLHNSTYGGPHSDELFHLPSALTETFVLLISSFTCGLAVLAAHHQERIKVIAWLFLTFILGGTFLTIELNEFSQLVQEGNSWERSAFLSSFFTLVGTHGLHITSGLIWLVALIPQIFFRGITVSTVRRLSCFSLFWHFLDVIWIFIFTLVYLMGVK